VTTVRALRRMALPLRILASVVMLALLLTRAPVRASLPAWTSRSTAWLVAALVATLLGVVLAALRWRQVLVTLGVRAQVRTLLSLYLAGQFVGNFLPSTVGGDVLRFSRLSARTGDSPDSFASVVLERLTGWLVLPVITLVGLAVNPGLRHLGVASDVALLTSLATLAVLALVIVGTGNRWLGRRLAGRAGWWRFAGAVHLGVEHFRRRPLAALGVLAVGFAYQLVVVAAAFLAARALGLTIGLTAVIAFMPAVAIAQVLPISLGGLGLREGAFVLFLHPLGVSTPDAVALGLLVYGLNLAASLLGAPAFAVGPPVAAAASDAGTTRAIA